MRSVERWRHVAIAGALFVAGVLVSVGLGERPNVTPTMRLDHRPGREVSVVLLVSPNCGASHHPELPGAWKSLLDAVAAGLGDSIPLRRVGVALSADPESGVAFLERFGLFHEITVGGGAQNSGGLRYMSSDFRGPTLIPQIVIIEREFAAESGNLRLSSETVARRIWGVDAILKTASRYASQ